MLKIKLSEKIQLVVHLLEIYSSLSFFPLFFNFWSNLGHIPSLNVVFKDEIFQGWSVSIFSSDGFVHDFFAWATFRNMTCSLTKATPDFKERSYPILEFLVCAAVCLLFKFENVVLCLHIFFFINLSIKQSSGVSGEVFSEWTIFASVSYSCACFANCVWVCYNPFFGYEKCFFVTW